MIIDIRKIKSFVINCEEKIERRENIAAQSSRLEMNYEITKAINGLPLMTASLYFPRVVV